MSGGLSVEPTTMDDVQSPAAVPVTAAGDTRALVAKDDQDRRAPGRPRSARADEAIIEAVLDLLSEGNSVEALSIESVAQRAGVGKATIYRRWPNKESLVVDAVAALKGPPAEIEGKSVREDLLTLLRPATQAKHSRAARIIPCLIPEVQRNPDLGRYYHRIMEPRRARMRSVLERGIAAGELRSDLDLEYVCAVLTGPTVAQLVLFWNPDLDPNKIAETTVDLVLSGMAV
jgi:AcrR family transcriptional regulator